MTGRPAACQQAGLLPDLARTRDGRLPGLGVTEILAAMLKMQVGTGTMGRKRQEGDGEHGGNR
jgi:hypothetical protein